MFDRKLARTEKKQDTRCSSEKVWKLWLHNHSGLILSKISSFQYDFESSQTTFMHEHHNHCFHNTTFVNCHRKTDARG